MDGYTEKRIKMLKERKERCVCRYCGSELELRRMMFHDIDEARTEIFCYHCDRIEFGAEKEIYMVAKYFVEEFRFDFQMGEGDADRNKRYSIAKVCDILSWGLKKMRYLDDTGFRVEPELDNRFLQECFCLYDKDLETGEGQLV